VDGPTALEATRQELRVLAMENVRLLNETKEALERQTATSEILRAISGSPTDRQPVLEAIASNAVRYCNAEDALVLLWESGGLTRKAHAGPVPSRGDSAQPSPADGQSVAGHAFIKRRTIQVPDIMNDPDHSLGRKIAEQTGHRTTLATPLLRQGEPIGVILLRRTIVQSFTPHQIQLVESFATQAVIAIENVRMFNETKDALEQQTATGEILRAIAASPTNEQPVLEAIARNAVRFCGAEDAAVLLRGDRGFRLGAHEGPLGADFRIELPLDDTSLTGRAMLRGELLHVVDITEMASELPTSYWMAVRTGHHAMAAAPLLLQGRAIGAILLGSSQRTPYSERQLELLRTFAAQAVIAIENVRLFNEIREKSGQLEVANDELAAASRHKSEFLANMSHELRTPLNAIIGFSDVLEQRLFGELNERQAEYTHDIATSGRHLLDLVNEILDLSKVEAGRMELEPSEFSLAETIHGALGFVRERAASHRITLTADVSTDLGTVRADERKVRQVLLNLLSNAVKFTPDGGTIAVRAQRRAGEVQVAVRDTGIGIAPEDQAKVFDEFQQVGTAGDRSREGTGLGLTLAKRFIELHGGRIWVESEIGKGTTLTFAIPVGAVAAPA
jgi:signal transduction histidine kinase